MSDAFTGAWLVTEYVYNPDGAFVGHVHQRRVLRPQADGTLEVYQRCQPRLQDAQHPMARFEGEWVFRLCRDGRHRRYLGPDVVGEGVSWGEDVITGRGIWPRFGHDFDSFGVMLSPQRQITGGRFYRGWQQVAFIVGLAVPERADAPEDYPRFSALRWATAYAATWQGSRTVYEADGQQAVQGAMTRRYRAEGWDDTTESGADVAVRHRTEGDSRFLEGPLYGHLRAGDFWLAGDVYTSAGAQEWLEILDDATQTLVRLVHHRALGRADRVEIAKLYPQDLTPR